DRGTFEEFKIEIYDKWGVLVWEQACKSPNCPDYSDSFWWTGTNKKGKQVSSGVYYWVVSAHYYSVDVKPLIKNGSVTIICK
ncbi:MAG: gliding motility-associated C-terminal domain-containing protein, partial [Bacteroidales bacterium]|nr:gliding motility-associated C-terminal domain-containing protein [Bacteroidales bacterium]